MVFGIDIKAALGFQRSGIGNYVFNLIENLIMLDSKNEYYLITPGLIPKSPFNLIPNFHLRSRYNLRNKLQQIDALHGPDFKLHSINAKKKIITIHDLASCSDQSFMSDKFKKLTKKKVIKAVKLADTIITVSNTIKNQLEEEFPISKGRIITVYHGVDKNIKYVSDESVRSLVKTKYNLPESFLLFVGNIEIRKNLFTLLKAFKGLKDELKIKHKLVLVGRSGWGFESIKKFITESNLTDSIVIIGWVNDFDLYTIYSLAELFVFPSFYEGFGLPIIEVMKCRLPVILSDIATHREIAEDSANYFKPTDSAELADSIFSLLKDENQKNILVQRGIEHSKFFDWNKTAKEMIKIYEN